MCLKILLSLIWLRLHFGASALMFQDILRSSFLLLTFCSIGFKDINWGQLLSEMLRSYIPFNTKNSLEFEKGAIFFSMGTSINLFTSLYLFLWRLLNCSCVVLWLSLSLLQNVSSGNIHYRKRQMLVLKYACYLFTGNSLWTETTWLL